MDEKAKMASLIQKLRVFGTCEIADALIKLKLPSGGYLPGIDSHSPKTAVDICGPAFTVEMVSQQDTDAPKPEKHFVDATEGYEGHIMVISAPPDTRSAVWGGLMTNRAQFNGIQGCIIDGRCRDLQEQFDANFAIYSRGHSILGQSPFTRPSRLQVPLEIKDPTSSTFPSTRISPGDLIRADIDGVVVCPTDLVEKVIELATKGREVDGNCKNDLLQGKTIKETFAKWRGK